MTHSWYTLCTADIQGAKMGRTYEYMMTQTVKVVRELADAEGCYDVPPLALPHILTQRVIVTPGQARRILQYLQALQVISREYVAIRRGHQLWPLAGVDRWRLLLPEARILKKNGLFQVE
jgi:hypothetical protein